MIQIPAPQPEKPTVDVTINQIGVTGITYTLDAFRTLTIEGIEVSADFLRHLFRPDNNPNRWYRFERKKIEGFDKETIIVHTILDVPRIEAIG